MLLPYEKEILEAFDERSTIIIPGIGMNTTAPIRRIISLYANPQSLLLLLNLSASDRKYLLTEQIEFIVDVSTMTVSQRRSAYERGGVFHGSSRIFTADAINKTISVPKISCIMILNAETVQEDGQEAFILDIFEKENPLRLFRAFISSPLHFSRRSLFDIQKYLPFAHVSLFPRIHQSVLDSIPESVIKKVYIKQPSIVEELGIMLSEVLKLAYYSKPGRSKDIDYLKLMLFYGTFSGIEKIWSLVWVLYNCDPFSFYICYKRIFDEEARNSEKQSWASSPISHLLLEKACEYVGLAREESGVFTGHEENVIADQDGLSCTDGEASAWAPAVAFQELATQSALRGESSESESGNGSSFDSSDASPCQATIPKGRHEIPDSAAPPSLSLQCFRRIYMNTPKIKKLCDLIKSNGGKNIAILVHNKTIQAAVSHIMLHLGVGGCVSCRLCKELSNDGEDYAVIILLGPRLEMIRAAEYYLATRGSADVFVLITKSSLEEQIYLLEIQEERALFARLMEEKAALPMKSRCVALDIGEDTAAIYKIIVDAREMRSRLPYYLYRAGNKIDVQTLKVGDYIVGGHCVERKSISDFISSLYSGRLYSQAKRILFQYKDPMLLLEFDQTFPTLLGHEKLDNFVNTLIAKFSLFLVNFPGFKIMWTNTPIFAVQCLRDLQKEEESSGAPSLVVDPALYEMLLSIPGIRTINVHIAMREFIDICDLAFADIGRLECLFGLEAAGLIFTFFRAPME